jgi:hypothetical protein
MIIGTTGTPERRFAETFLCVSHEGKFRKAGPKLSLMSPNGAAFINPVLGFRSENRFFAYFLKDSLRFWTLCGNCLNPAQLGATRWPSRRWNFTRPAAFCDCARNRCSSRASRTVSRFPR